MPEAEVIGRRDGDWQLMDTFSSLGDEYVLNLGLGCSDGQANMTDFSFFFLFYLFFLFMTKNKYDWFLLLLTSGVFRKNIK